MSSAKKVSGRKLESAVFRYKPERGMSLGESIRSTINLFVPMLSIGYTFDTGNSGAYTYVSDKLGRKRMIMVGGRLVAKIVDLPEFFSDKEKAVVYISDIKTAILGLSYHELGHNMFTDMVSKFIVEYPDEKKRNLIHRVFNLLEDPKEEDAMSSYVEEKYPYKVSPRKYFRFIVERIFVPQAEKYEDDGSLGNFLNYLLLLVRVGYKNIASKNDVFEKHREDLVPLIKAFLMEPNGTERIHRCIELCEWMFENIKEFDWDSADEVPKEERVSGAMSKARDSDSGTTLEAPSSSSMSSKLGDEGEESEGSPSDGSDGSDGEGDGTEPESGSVDLDDPCEDEEVLDDVFNDFVHDGDDYDVVIAKEVYGYDDNIVEALDERVAPYIDTCHDVSKFLTLFKDRVKEKSVSGFKSGKLNIRKAMQADAKGGGDLRVFNRKVKMGEDTDLAVYLLGDNSGSMSGSKSVLCCNAMLTVAQACDWSDIPLKVSCFTRTSDAPNGISITIVEKDWEDSFEKSKPYFAINDSHLVRRLKSDRDIPTFSGNWEEVNLYYIWQELKKVKHKTKMLIVMCDGETCGSKEDLKEIVRKMEAEDGIIVLGIGIQCDTVATIYPHHKLFGSEEELKNELADYLVETISKYASR